MLLFVQHAAVTKISWAGQKPTDTPTSAVSSRPNPDGEGRYHVGDGVLPPVLISSVEPVFPESARKKRFHGVCLVALTVGIDGLPTDVSVKKSATEGVPAKQRAAGEDLDEAALIAVKQYRFKPATLQGDPVPLQIHVEVNFQMR